MFKEDSIVSAGRTATDAGEQLKIVYTGADLPATFRGHAQALAGGQLGADGVFWAKKLLAKSAEW